MGDPEHDRVLDALAGLATALHENIDGHRRAIARAEEIRRARAQGLSYREIVTNEERPLIVELTRESLDRLLHHGARLRRVEARTLHSEGMTMEEIASLFGVTRQRVSALLREEADGGADPRPEA
jgi:transcriptional regulator with XRE-family HTH domain